MTVFIVSPAGALLTSFATNTFGSSNPYGIAYIPTTGNLAIVDPTQDEVYIVTLGGVPLSHFDTGALGINNPVGIAFLPSTGGFAIIDSSLELFLVNASGALQDRFSIALGGISMDIEDVAFNSDGGTLVFVDRTQEEVFVFDIRGHVLSQFSTSLLLASHDPSGITFVQPSKTWALVDRIKREIVFFDSAGKLLGTCDIFGLTNNPTGIAYLPGPGNFAITDDSTQDRILILSPACSLMASFNTQTFGINSPNPSGITYRSKDGTLAFADLTRDVVAFFNTSRPGRIQGQFGTALFGSSRPEGVGYIPASDRFAVIDRDRENIPRAEAQRRR